MVSDYYRTLEDVGIDEEDRDRIQTAAKSDAHHTVDALLDDPYWRAKDGADPHVDWEEAWSKAVITHAILPKTTPFTADEIAAETNYDQTRVHDQIRALRVNGYVERAESGRWQVVEGTIEPETREELLDHAAGYGADVYGAGLYGCEIEECEGRFETYHGLRTHVGMVHPEDARRYGRYRCPDCEDGFPTYRGMRIHWAREHKPEPTVECEWGGCTELFQTEGGMRRHHARVHGESIAVWRDREYHTTSNEPHDCPDCGRTFATKGAMTRHHREVHEETDEDGFPCPDCHRVLPTEHGRKVHYGRVHEGSIAETERARQLRAA